MKTLVSAMHLADYKYIDILNIQTDAVIINQCDRDERQEIQALEDEKGRNVLFLSSTERGLSKSRNQAIRESARLGTDVEHRDAAEADVEHRDAADDDICIFCDNDVVYEDNAKDLITGAFSRHPEADIIVFFIRRPERQAPIREAEGDLKYSGAMKIFSPEIAFRRSSLVKNNLYMNELFGAGAKYGMGEENIFLFEAIGKGMKVLYCPVEIAHILDTESTWFHGYTDKFFTDRGANYYAMTRKWYWLLILQFAVRKRALYRGDNRMFHAISVMFAGAREYKGLLAGGKGMVD